MKKYISIIFFLIFSISASQRPNILFIIMDDLNDLPSLPSNNRAIATPHMDRIANNGVNFTNAHSNDPICAPSRASMLYGIYPQTSGLIWFESPKQRSILKNSVDLPGHLSKNGYNVFGTGKIYHGGKNNRAFKSYGVGNNFGPHPINGDSFMGHHSSQDHLFEKFPNLPYKWEQTFGSLNDIPDWSHLEKENKGGFYTENLGIYDRVIIEINFPMKCLLIIALKS